ncbi:hypothetical protein A8C56_08025 [Niabella ginsenosidivorans]|uniref:Uncharacterized protein n=1 Tax=Niabella ginsenosidivorans TaxID=1176587 RepID=A0A1A9HZV3_9BACT|nr:oligosaccharide flippase family protein [Niabella ginsenosidivorans]ANH80937.1 hypothetical protein A8C56_08025 [Niabella ginsenosidivorans]
MIKTVYSFRKNIKDRAFAQTSYLLISTVLGIILGVISTSLLTRVLGKEQYGNYALIFNIFSFCQIIFSFGVFHSISRLVAITNDPKKVRGYYLAGCFLVLLLFVIMSIALIFYAYFSKSIAKSNLTGILLISIPLSWVYLLTNLNESFLQGDNKINLLSMSRFLPKVYFTLTLAIVYFCSLRADLISMILINYFTFILAYAYIFIKTKPTKSNFKRRLLEIFSATKRFGFDIYFGALVASGSGSLSGILISQFGVNNIEVGYYTLATFLSSPLTLVPNIIATVQFKSFSKSNKISRNLTLTMLGISLSLFIAIVLSAKFVILLVFGKDFINAIDILKYLSIGYVLYGIGDYYNRFLLAKGKGKELRNASFYVGITLLIANVAFIKLFGGQGAAIARIVSGLMYTFVILYYYKRETNT